MDDALRNSLWNVLLGMFDPDRQSAERWTTAAPWLARNFFDFPADDVPTDWYGSARGWVKARFYALKWFDVYNLIAHLRPWAPYMASSAWTPEIYEKVINLKLERGNAGYRFIGGRLAPITHQAEVDAVEAARAKASASGLDTARIHIDAALDALGRRPVPDHRTAINEAISAVESATKLIGKTTGQGLAGPLKELAEKTEMHGALRDAFIKLYGWTSDGGIRHGMEDELKLDTADARFMVIACSAFVHFLIEKAESAGLLKT